MSTSAHAPGVANDAGADPTGSQQNSVASGLDAGLVGPALTAVLFPDVSTHLFWRAVISQDVFQPAESLSWQERTALAYKRLRMLGREIPDPLALVGDPTALAALHEWTAIVDNSLTTAATIHYNLFLGSLVDHDPCAARDLGEFTTVATVGTYLVTEAGHGNDIAALETTATFDRRSGEFDLHTPHPGAAKFMPNNSPIGGPKSGLVAARLLIDGIDHGAFLFLLPLTDHEHARAGVEITLLPDRLGSPTDHCITSFHHVKLPRTALLEGDHGRLDPNGGLQTAVSSPRRRLFHSVGRITTGKLCMSAAALGVARAALAIAVHHAYHRHIAGLSGGQRLPLAALRSHHSRLLEALAKVYAMTFLYRDAAKRWASHTPEDRAQAEKLVSITKGWVTWQARATIVECRERCGAQGLFLDNLIAGYLTSVEGAITAEGDNLAIWCRAAAQMLAESDTTVGRSRRVAGSADVWDLTSLHELLERCEHIWNLRATRCMQADPAADLLGGWNGAASSALQSVACRAGHEAARTFISAVDAVGDPAARSLLEELCRLFLLTEIRTRTGDLLADGYISAQFVRDLPDVIESSTAALAPHMAVLADAFDIPAHLVAKIPMFSCPG